MNFITFDKQVPINASSPQQTRQTVQSQSSKQLTPTPQPCITILNPVNNWSGSTSKSTSLLHPSTIFLTQTPQAYATLSAVQSNASSSSAQTSKLNPNETIVIP